MCVGYSTLGKKVDGALLKEESVHNKLMLLWASFHGRKRTPLLIHENVTNFKSEYLAEKLEHYGYHHITSIKTVGQDCGLHVNNRKRRLFVEEETLTGNLTWQ